MWTSLTLGLSSKIMEPTGVIVDVPRSSKSGSRANSVWSLPASPEPWSDRGEAHSPRAGLNLDLRPDLGCRSLWASLNKCVTSGGASVSMQE